MGPKWHSVLVDNEKGVGEDTTTSDAGLKKGGRGGRNSSVCCIAYASDAPAEPGANDTCPDLSVGAHGWLHQHAGWSETRCFAKALYLRSILTPDGSRKEFERLVAAIKGIRHAKSIMRALPVGCDVARGAMEPVVRLSASDAARVAMGSLLISPSSSTDPDRLNNRRVIITSANEYTNDALKNMEVAHLFVVSNKGGVPYKLIDKCAERRGASTVCMCGVDMRPNAWGQVSNSANVRFATATAMLSSADNVCFSRCQVKTKFLTASLSRKDSSDRMSVTLHKQEAPSSWEVLRAERVVLSRTACPKSLKTHTPPMRGIRALTLHRSNVDAEMLTHLGLGAAVGGSALQELHVLHARSAKRLSRPLADAWSKCQSLLVLNLVDVDLSDAPTSDALARMVGTSPSLKVLGLGNNALRPTEAWKTGLSQNTSLRALILGGAVVQHDPKRGKRTRRVGSRSFCTQDSIGVTIAGYIGSHAQSALETLSIASCNPSSRFFSDLASNVSVRRSLRTLHCDDCRGIGGAAATCISNLERLEELTLDNCRVEEKAMATLMAQMPRIRRFSSGGGTLGGAYASSSPYDALSDAVRVVGSGKDAAPATEALLLYGAQMLARDAQNVLESATLMTRLKMLVLSGLVGPSSNEKYHFRVVAALGQTLAMASKLEEIHLSHMHLTDLEVARLVAKLSDTVRCLDLSHNRAAEMTCEALRKRTSRSLRYVDLRANEVRDSMDVHWHMDLLFGDPQKGARERVLQYFELTADRSNRASVDVEGRNVSISISFPYSESTRIEPLVASLNDERMGSLLGLRCRRTEGPKWELGSPFSRCVASTKYLTVLDARENHLEHLRDELPWSVLV